MNINWKYYKYCILFYTFNSLQLQGLWYIFSESALKCKKSGPHRSVKEFLCSCCLTKFPRCNCFCCKLSVVVALTRLSEDISVVEKCKIYDWLSNVFGIVMWFMWLYQTEEEDEKLFWMMKIVLNSLVTLGFSHRYHVWWLWLLVFLPHI